MKNITRTEKKYLADRSVIDSFIAGISPHMAEDLYFRQRIHNVYFDNDNNEVIRHSLEKQEFKEKLRLRGYEIKGRLCPYVYLELKKKFKGVVYKRRLMLPPEEGRKVLSGTREEVYALLGESPVGQEIRAYMERTGCYPKQYLSYERFSYRGKDDGELRITIDTGLKSRESSLSLGAAAEDESYWEEQKYIIEIKATSGMPLWLVHLLTSLGLYPVSFSKYGKIYLKKLSEGLHRETKQCLTA